MIKSGCKFDQRFPGGFYVKDESEGAWIMVVY